MWWTPLLLFLLTFAPHVSAAIVINEIFPKTEPITNEWIELYNTDTNPVTLDKWRLENASGSNASIFNASATIGPKEFLTIYQTQSGLTLNINGDTVRLFDDKNILVDSQSYPGTLGYNTSMGRSSDGGSGWVICTPNPEYVSTPNTTNKCPQPPTNTPTSTLTITPTNTPTRTVVYATPTAIIATTGQKTTIDTSSNFAFPNVLGDVTSQTPTLTPAPANFQEQDSFKKIWMIIMIIGVSFALVIMSIGMYKTRNKIRN